MERKQLIRPVTIEKVKVFMRAVSEKIYAGETFSLDLLAREHSISGSTGTAMVRNAWISLTDVKHQYLFNEDPYIINDSNAKLLIEQVRLHNYKKHNQNKEALSDSAFSHRNNVTRENQEEGDEMVTFKNKTLKSPEIASVLEKIFVKMNEGKQSDIFDGISNVHNERIHVASAISSGIWASLGLGQDFPRMSEEHIRQVNARIAFTAVDLIDQILNFKKVNK